MFRRIVGHIAFQLVLASFASIALSQEQPKPLRSGDPRLDFSFSVKPSANPLKFSVELDESGWITAVSVYQNGGRKPTQRLDICAKPLDQITEGWEDYELSYLISHADFNFDGFEDLELLVAYVPHLDKKIYCIYLWDQKSKTFVFSKQLSDVSSNLEPHPESKTLTSHEYWFGGPWQESTYRWQGNKLRAIQTSSLLGDWSSQTSDQCGFTYFCTRLINGKMVVTLSKPVCSSEEMDNLPSCPVAPVRSKAKLTTSQKPR